MKELNLKLIIILSLLFSGCEEKDMIPYYQISEEIKTWIFYKTNSYWIYQDSSSYQFDSIVVENSSIVKKYQDTQPHGSNAYYYDELHITYNKENYYSLLSERMISGSSLTRRYKDTIDYPYFDLEHNELGLEIGFSDSEGKELGSTTFLNHYDKYTLYHNTFNDVFEIRIEDFVRQCTIHYFLAKHVGIIKKKVDNGVDTQTWNLIRWDVEQ